MSGQPFLDLLDWDPRDVDTLQEIFEDQAAEQRLAAERARVQHMMGG